VSHAGRCLSIEFIQLLLLMRVRKLCLDLLTDALRKSSDVCGLKGEPDDGACHVR